MASVPSSTTVAHGVRSAAEIYQYAAHAGNGKARMPMLRGALMAILGGVFISLGSLLGMEVAGLAGTTPGFTRFLFGVLFPAGFISVTMTLAPIFSRPTVCTALWHGGSGRLTLAC